MWKVPIRAIVDVANFIRYPEPIIGVTHTLATIAITAIDASLAEEEDEGDYSELVCDTFALVSSGIFTLIDLRLENIEETQDTLDSWAIFLQFEFYRYRQYFFYFPFYLGVMNDLIQLDRKRKKKEQIPVLRATSLFLKALLIWSGGVPWFIADPVRWVCDPILSLLEDLATPSRFRIVSENLYE